MGPTLAGTPLLPLTTPVASPALRKAAAPVKSLKELAKAAKAIINAPPKPAILAKADPSKTTEGAKAFFSAMKPGAANAAAEASPATAKSAEAATPAETPKAAVPD